MSKLPLLYVQGVNGSFAQRLMPEDQMRTVNDSTNDRWVVIGAHDALDQAEKGEYGYTIDADFDEIMKLPTDTPIYASVNSFESFNKEDHESYQTDDIVTTPLASDYETVGDLFAAAKDAIHDAYNDCENDEERSHFNVYNMYSFEAIKAVAANIWYNADWASLITEGDQIRMDIEYCLNQGEYDAYPEFLQE